MTSIVNNLEEKFLLKARKTPQLGAD